MKSLDYSFDGFVAAKMRVRWAADRLKMGWVQGEFGAANARIAGYSVPVCALVGYLEAVNGDVGQVARDYGLPQDAVQAALAYYEPHRDFLDDRLAANAG